MRGWSTVELLCAGHPHRPDHSPAERRAARLALRERRIAGPVRVFLTLLTLPTVRDAWDGGAGWPDVLRGWAALVLVLTGVATPLLAKLGDARLVRRAVVAGALGSLLLFALAQLGYRRRGGATRRR